MQLRKYLFPNIKDDAWGPREREARLRRFADGLLIYVLPLIALFVVDAIGLWRVDGSLWGMYGNDDGMWAAWNLEGILQWGRPFDLAPFNPLSGMGSTFLPNTPWLNPAALAHALPFAREIRYLIAYFIYFVELSASLILLFRVIGLRPLEAVLCTQFYLLILFPPTGPLFGTLVWYTLAPVNAHLVAICNLLLVLILAIGRYGFWTNVAYGAGIVFLFLCGIFSAPVGLVTYAPVYSFAGAALLLGSKPAAKELGWKLAAILSTAALLWLAGVNDYLRGTALISSRAIYYPPAFAAGADLLTWTYWRNVWRGFDTCNYALLLCPRVPIFYLHIASLVGAALCIVERTKFRPLALGMLFFFACLHLFDLASRVSLFGSIHVISPAFLSWSSYPFLVLFLGLLIFRVWRFVKRPLFRAWRFIRRPLAEILIACAVLVPHPSKRAVRTGTSTLAAAALGLAIPAIALAHWQFRARLHQPPPPAHNSKFALLGQSGVRHAKIGPITRYLIDHVRIAPDAPFRGYTTTYLADPQGPLSQRLQQPGSVGVTTYIAARYYFDRYYQNRLIETDLWEENIPTLEEYGQWVTKQVQLAVDMLFSPIPEPRVESFRSNGSVFLRLYHLKLDLLPVLGVRYVITDIELHDPRATLRAEQPADGAPTMYLYELAGANLGTWSPTKSVVARNFDDAIALLRSRKFDLSDTAVVFSPLEGALVPARNVTFRFVRGGFHVTADAAGPAAIVLPVQYSKCWRTQKSRSGIDAPRVDLQPVNAIQTLLRFSGHVDVTFQFALGFLGDMGCRLQDGAELKLLGVD